jgi:hypothetical protein
LPRLLSTFLVLGLLGGTAAAFAVTERLKLVPTPIIAPYVTPAFSPTCGCDTRSAVVRFRLRDGDRLTVAIVNAGGNAVATIAEDLELPAGPVSFEWDGRETLEGTYRVRVHFARGRRTITIPNPTRLDATAPVLTVKSVAPDVFSPDGDGRADKVKVSFAVSEPSRVSLLVDGTREIVTPPRRNGTLDWYARRERPGRYSLALVAHDLAGNVSRPSPPAVVRLRFISIAPRRVVVPAGVRFGVGVSTDGKRYAWRLGSQRGSSTRGALVLRAPQRAGRYTLVVTLRGHHDAIPVFVRARA